MGQYYNPQIVNINDLALYYDAGNIVSNPGTGASWFDLSTYANTALLTGTAFSTESNRKSIYFNGTNSIVDVGTNGQNLTTAWSIECWCNPISYGENNEGRIYQHTTGSLTGFLFSLDNTGTTAGLLIRTYAVAGFVARVPNVVSLNTWQHLAVTFSSGTITWYKNGAALGTSSITSPSAYTSTNYIGNTSGLDRTFDGNIAVFKLYRTTLTAAQMAKNYNALKGRFGL